MKVAVVGGGLVGLATALELARSGCAVQLFEKESRVGQHQSTHNSGVLHAGLYYKPGSLKATLAVSGLRRMVEFCEHHRVPYERCGKIVVAADVAEVPRLKELFERGTRNGLRGLRWLAREEIREVEPHAAGVAAVHVPEEGIVDYAAVCSAMERELRREGGELLLGARVESIRREGAIRLVTTRGDFVVDYAVNCGGLHSDRIAVAAGARPAARIVPFRGEYYRLARAADGLVRNLIYPVPDPTFPFLGVHFTRLIHGGVEAGPNAVLAFAREGYRKTTLRVGDMIDALGYSGLWRFMRQHRSMAWQEFRRSHSKQLFCASLQRLVPEVSEEHLEAGGSGVRAQAMLPDGTLVQDFCFAESERILHVLNAPSPAATASLAIGAHVCAKVLRAVGSSLCAS
jgi:L-2-hydroxyglutarate oxidase LhgO